MIGNLESRLIDAWSGIAPSVVKAPQEVYEIFKHSIASIDRGIGQIQLADGSEWRVDFEDQAGINSWNIGDKIVFSLSNSSNRYCAVKINTEGKASSSIKVSLFILPKNDSGFEIVKTNVENIEINNRDPLIKYPNPIKFVVTKEGREEIKRWDVSDSIILAMKHSPNHSEYNPNEFVLINCILLSHIPVSLI